MTDTPKKTTIVINGQEVGPEAVPEFLRKFVADADKNGIPDFMDQMFKNPLLKMVLGKAGANLQSQLAGLQNLTPEQKKKIAALMETLSGSERGSVVVDASPTETRTVSFSRPSVPHNPLHIDYEKMGIENPDKKSSLPWLFIVALLGVIIALAGYIFLRGR
jgi:hypothetical protein